MKVGKWLLISIYRVGLKKTAHSPSGVIFTNSGYLKSRLHPCLDQRISGLYQFNTQTPNIPIMVLSREDLVGFRTLLSLGWSPNQIFEYTVVYRVGNNLFKISNIQNL